MIIHKEIEFIRKEFVADLLVETIKNLETEIDTNKMLRIIEDTLRHLKKKKRKILKQIAKHG